MKIHVDIDPSSINKTSRSTFRSSADCAHVLEDMLRLWRAGAKSDREKSASTKPAVKKALADWWQQIDRWRARKSLAYRIRTT